MEVTRKLNTMKPVLTSFESLWPTRIAMYDFGLSQSALNSLIELVLQKEQQHAFNGTERQLGRFPPFSSLYKKQGFQEWDEASAVDLRRRIDIVARDYIDKTLGSDVVIEQIDVWANIHRATNWHGPHSHYSGGRETASGVVWITSPEETEKCDANGAFVFADPRGPYHPGRTHKTIRPQPGHGLLFPSWQQHYVTPVEMHSLRISFGFDVLCNRIVP